MLPKEIAEGTFNRVKNWLLFECNEEDCSVFFEEDSILFLYNGEKCTSPLYNTMVSCLSKGLVGWSDLHHIILPLSIFFIELMCVSSYP